MVISVVPRGVFEFDTVEHYIGDAIECFDADDWGFISNLQVFPEYCYIDDYPCYLGSVTTGIYEFGDNMYCFESGIICIMPFELVCRGYGRAEVMRDICKDKFGWVSDYKDSDAESIEYGDDGHLYIDGFKVDLLERI